MNKNKTITTMIINKHFGRAIFFSIFEKEMHTNITSVKKKIAQKFLIKNFLIIPSLYPWRPINKINFKGNKKSIYQFAYNHDNIDICVCVCNLVFWFVVVVGNNCFRNIQSTTFTKTNQI